MTVRCDIYYYMVIGNYSGNRNPVVIGNALINSDRLTSLHAGSVECNLSCAIASMCVYIHNAEQGTLTLSKCFCRINSLKIGL